MAEKYNLITILGPTASGKTALAANIAYRLNGEVISADSRQVYRDMNIGTGKDYDDYSVESREVPCHLVDICDAGEKYSVYRYQKDFVTVYNEISDRNKLPVLCGGTGMYIESVLKGYRLLKVPVNKSLRNNLERKTMDEMKDILGGYRNLHNITDVSQRKRLVRAIEIAKYYSDHNIDEEKFPEIKSLVAGIKFDRNSRRKRISERLKERLKSGMIEEVKSLLESGVSADTLIYYGLEYKFITWYIQGELSYNEMFSQLETSIHRFAKRQMTWFRRMERNGIEIKWLDGYLPLNEKVEKVMEWYSG
ncbi:MAG: tRNA (adenosine(37)-N6)-dimethylallyltransferase MiaA, partial [Bacteroidales bacterium]|nr:tRNA (adenosine(37)-N6)-dimethylallyltransferase MiaA [Bacteroidales bacterium]